MQYPEIHLSFSNLITHCLAGQGTVSRPNEEVVEFYIAQTHGGHVTIILGVFTMLQHSVHLPSCMNVTNWKLMKRFS